MPWTNKNYPTSMKYMPAKVRHKAIEIANALLEEGGMQEGVVIATAISRAKDWAANRGIATKSKNPKSRSKDVKVHGEDRYVLPFEGEWAVKGEGDKKVEAVYHDKEEAVRRAKKEAKKLHTSVTIQRKTGKVQKRISYTPHTR